jgi:hypothetical protein
MGKRRKRLRRANMEAERASKVAPKVAPKPAAKPVAKPVVKAPAIKASAPVAHAADLVSPRSPKLATAKPLPRKKVNKK